MFRDIEILNNLHSRIRDDLEKQQPNLVIYQYRVAGSDPRLSSTRRVRFTVSQTRMRVPLSDAVATRVPCEFKAKQATSP